MKPAILAVALMLGGAAIAQTTTPQTTSSHDATHTPTGTMTDHRGMDHSTMPANTSATTTSAAPASGPVVSAGNENPKRDARGIKVMSDPAVVPAGFNGVADSGGIGGPLVDPATGETVDASAPASTPACTADITDSCLQTYERGRRPQ